MAEMSSPVGIRREMQRIRSERPHLPPSALAGTWRSDDSGEAFAMAWFRTIGCRFDRAGECTMCNFGSSEPVDTRAVLDAFAAELRLLKQPLGAILVCAAGSFLDPWEVPEDLRIPILELVGHVSVRRILFETRPEFVSSGSLKDLEVAVAAERIGIEIGLESSNPTTLRRSIGKSCSPEDTRGAIEIIKSRGMTAHVNISVGHAFMSWIDAVEDASRSIDWALDAGVDECVLFPLHIKPYTLLDSLHKRGAYRVIPLWAVVDVLWSVRKVAGDKVTVSWLTGQYPGGYAWGDERAVEPTTCPECFPDVLRILTRFRQTRDFATIEALKTFPCACRLRWERYATTSGRNEDR